MNRATAPQAAKAFRPTCTIAVPLRCTTTRAIHHPDPARNESLGTVPLRDEALSLSAVWGRSFEAEGKTLGHVLDPRRGYPVDSAVLSVVVGASATETDALSTALLVRGAVVEDKLLKRPEFKQLDFSLTRDESDADIILELRHDLLTKYVFSVVQVKTQTVIAGGKLSSLGGTVAGKVAKRFVKEMR